MHITPLPLQDAFLLKLQRWKDPRGSFTEAFRKSWEKELNLPPFVQDNVSYSRQGVLRGLHFQKPPAAQAKLITTLYGHIQDVIVDLRPNSPTYKQWTAVELRSDSDSWEWLYVPIGFAHGFLVLSAEAYVWYRCSAYYEPSLDAGIRWDDPTLRIAWALGPNPPILSQKDANLPFLQDLEPNPFL
jgi:dTDP-4-dehydrorhamnose 3,5-epimerase